MQMERVMVFSAHALDFLWREGGMIARYVKEGCPVIVAQLSRQKSKIFIMN